MHTFRKTPAPSAPLLFTRRAFLGSLAASAALAGLPGAAFAAGPLRVLAATYPACLACSAVMDGLPGMELDLLVAAQTGCPHDYAMTPRDRMKLEECDVLVLNGGGFESFLDDRLLSGLSAQVVDAGAGIDMSAAPGPKEHEHDEHGHEAHDHEHEGEHEEEPGHHHHHGAGNPHYFSSPAAFAVMAGNVAAALGKKCPEQAAVLKERADALAVSMGALSADLQALPGEGMHLVVQHDTLSWFFRGTSFHIEAVLQEEADDAPSAAALLALVNRIKAGGTWLLVGEPQFPGQVMDTLAAETGAKKIYVNPLASGPYPVPAGLYEKTMRENIAVLAAAVGK
ncbi:MAG: metal ABC transporter substrate-binding protein [Desulfovibrionaceae bacterium]|nr:metal ABC transporter substrate-binding protein [Desulfovibrionaceae bacterium]